MGIKFRIKKSIATFEYIEYIKSKLKKPYDAEVKSHLSLQDERRLYKEIKGIIESSPPVYDQLVADLTNYSAMTKNMQYNRQRVIMEIIHDLLSDRLEKTDDFREYMRLIYEQYPSLLDDDFNNKLLTLPEFGSRKIPIQTGDKASVIKTKTAAQKFVKSYISPQTPYNGLLLWHGVGTGKTRAAISIAENFIGIKGGKRVLILLPSGTLEGNWRDEIFNIQYYLDNKGKDMGFGRRYKAELEAVLRDGASEEVIRRQAKRVVDKYFEIRGYLEFANKIKRELNNFVEFAIDKETKTIEFIRSQYSNMLIIMDEVHVTRAGGATEDKASRTYLELIARYAENTKLVLLSATPMYNTTDEIVWLLNLLLWNDKRAPLLEEDYFEKDGVSLKDDAVKGLLERSRGYISYLRGENPFTFPIKLEPTDEKAIIIKKTREAIINQKKMKIHTAIEGLKFYQAKMSEYQYAKLMDVYLDKKHQSDLEEEEISDIEDADEMYETDLKMKSSFSATVSQASNIVFPDSSGEAEIGDDGFTQCFFKDGGVFKLKPHALEWNETELPFIHKDNLPIFSQKFANILECIERNRSGISFIYSQFINAGINILSLILEVNGFAKYDGNDKETTLITNYKCPKSNRFCAIHKKYYRDLTEEEKKSFKQARFIALDGSMDKNKLTSLVREARGEMEGRKNTHGEHILVILGSRVVEQGISFKCVRDTHIVDPWFHLNSMEQATGRSIRNFSHMTLPPEERNVSVYIHISSKPDTISDKLETTDERIYRIAYEKKEKMSEVERQLKTHAIDCFLNANSNYFVASQYTTNKPLEDVLVINSRGETINRSPKGDKVADENDTTNLYDRDKSLLCDLEKCEYKCKNVSEIDVEQKQRELFNVDVAFIEDDIDSVKDYIGYLFQSEFIFLVDADIIYSKLKDQKIDLLGDETTIKYNIGQALKEMEQDGDMIVDKYNRQGLLQNVNVKGRQVWVFRPNARIGEMRNGRLEQIVGREIEQGIEQRMILNPIIRNPDTLKADPFVNVAVQEVVEDRSILLKQIATIYRKILANDFKKIELENIPTIIYTKSSKPSAEEWHRALLYQYLDRLNINVRQALLEEVVKTLIDGKTDEDIIQVLREYFGETTNKPIRWFNILRENNRIIGYRLVNDKGTVNYYIYSEGTFSPIKDLDRLSDINTDLTPYNMNLNKITAFGYEYDKLPTHYEFYTVARDPDIKLKKNNQIHKRYLIKGAKCGDSKLNKTFRVSELLDIIKSEVSADIFSDSFDKKGKRTMCNEIALLWRIRDIRDGRQYSRYFYSSEEARLFFKKLINEAL